VCTDTGCCSHSTVMIGLPATPAASYLATLEGEKQLELPLFIPLSLSLSPNILTHSLNSTLFVHISFTLSSSVFSLSLESFFLCFLPTLSPFAHLSALFSVCISLFHLSSWDLQLLCCFLSFSCSLFCRFILISWTASVVLWVNLFSLCLCFTLYFHLSLFLFHVLIQSCEVCVCVCVFQCNTPGSSSRGCHNTSSGFLCITSTHLCLSLNAVCVRERER